MSFETKQFQPIGGVDHTYLWSNLVWVVIVMCCVCLLQPRMSCHWGKQQHLLILLITQVCVHKSEKYKSISMSKHLSSHLLCLCSQRTCWDEKNMIFMISASDLHVNVKVPQNVIILTKKTQKLQICIILYYSYSHLHPFIDILNFTLFNLFYSPYIFSLLLSKISLYLYFCSWFIIDALRLLSTSSWLFIFIC